ncbi:MAG TPA: sugar ABC transporter permease [Propionicimonas sp.]|uniref:carbohydrate ABC transporter permease n=1 Tax=Propionicimonas sp. TaxID=1955623 RepID=UPI002F3E47E7
MSVQPESGETTTATSPLAVRRRTARGGRWRQRLEIAFFVGPALVLFALFVVVPIVQAARYSMFKWNGLGPLRNFVGLQNYVNALSDEVFRGAIANNFLIAGLSILIQLPLGLAVALLLNRRIRGRGLLRVVVFVPYVLAEVVAGVIWLMLLQPGGVADATLTSLGLGGLVQLWLGDPNVALGTVFFVLTWKYLGQAIILFLAGLQGVPDELYEAAQIDGASWWQIQRRIAIPLLGPTMRTWAFLAIIGSLQVFDMIWILTRGGPVNSTMTMAIYMITQGSKRTLYGYASAVAVILFIISVAVASLYQGFILRRDNVSEATPRGVTR